jgi:hypothetical protein
MPLEHVFVRARQGFTHLHGALFQSERDGQAFRVKRRRFMENAKKSVGAMVVVALVLATLGLFGIWVVLVALAGVFKGSSYVLRQPSRLADIFASGADKAVSGIENLMARSAAKRAGISVEAYQARVAADEEAKARAAAHKAEAAKAAAAPVAEAVPGNGAAPEPAQG